MRTKSGEDFSKQAERIRSGYGWKQRKDKYNHDRFLAICRKVREIEMRYIRKIGDYQRQVEGFTRDQQSNDFEKFYRMKYPVSVYAKK